MRNYLAVWSWTSETDGRRREVTMSFWARSEADARSFAGVWFNHVEPVAYPCDFTLTDLSAERSAP